jgi:hypothetical protein
MPRVTNKLAPNLKVRSLRRKTLRLQLLTVLIDFALHQATGNTPPPYTYPATIYSYVDIIRYCNSLSTTSLKARPVALE